MPASARISLLFLCLVAAPAKPAELDPAALDRGSEMAYQRALAPLASERRLNADAAMSARARRIVNRLIVAATAMHPAARNYAWTVNVVPGNAPDVSGLPGGRLIVNHALFAGTNLSEEETAAILAHVVAHSLLGHDASQVAARTASRPASPDPNRQVVDVADALTEIMRAPRYSAAEIAAADRTSVELLARAAYDPRATGSVWRRLAQTSEGIAERAPVSDERLAALDAAIKAALPLYEETRAKAAAAQAKTPLPPITGRPAPPR